MFELNSDDFLVRVHRYAVSRKIKGAVFVDIHEWMGGKPWKWDKKFVAIPTNAINGFALEKYFFWADTEDEALSGCLKKIKDASFEDLFQMPNLSKTPPGHQL